jgi:hypothetical protein
MTKLRMGFSAAIAMPTEDVPAGMTNPTPAACAAARGSMLHNSGLRHRKDQHAWLCPAMLKVHLDVGLLLTFRLRRKFPSRQAAHPFRAYAPASVGPQERTTKVR